MIDVPTNGESLARILEEKGFVNLSGKPLEIQRYSPYFWPSGFRISSFLCETDYYRPIPRAITEIANEHSPDAVINVAFVSNRKK
jgi:hypothetical protein